MTNTTLRERFKLNDKARTQISNLIRDAIDAKRIKRKDDSLSSSTKFVEYMPYWVCFSLHLKAEKKLRSEVHNVHARFAKRLRRFCNYVCNFCMIWFLQNIAVCKICSFFASSGIYIDCTHSANQPYVCPNH